MLSFPDRKIVSFFASLAERSSIAKSLFPRSALFRTRAFACPSREGTGHRETNDEIVETLRDLREHRVDVVTIGQHLQPSAKHAKIDWRVDPDEFRWFREQARRSASARSSCPLVRSSYRADR